MGTFETCLKLEDFKTPEKVGGEEVLIPLKNEAKIKIKRPEKFNGGKLMQRDRSTYTGLPRAEIDWFPRIDQEKCRPEECNFHCVEFCPFGVFSKASAAVQVSKPYECNVGDESCRFQCPLDAISFPTREELREMLRIVRAKHQQN